MMWGHPNCWPLGANQGGAKADIAKRGPGIWALPRSAPSADRRYSMIYLVTQGEFDDYQVIYAFQSEEAAKRHVKWWNTYWLASPDGSMTRRVEAHEVLTDAPKMNRSNLARTGSRTVIG